MCHEEIPAKLTGRDIAVMSPALIELTDFLEENICISVQGVNCRRDWNV